MKVSDAPKLVVTPTEPEVKAQVEESKDPGDAIESMVKGAFDNSDKYSSGSAAPDADPTGEMDPVLEHLLFLSSTPKIPSSEPFVPTWHSIKVDAEKRGIAITEEFLDAVKEKYVDLAARIEQSRRSLVELKDQNMHASGDCHEAIKKCERAWEKIYGKGSKPGELQKIETVRTALVDINKKEMEVYLPMYLKAYYKWSVKHEAGEATYKDKPNLYDYNLNNDGNTWIGGPDSKLVIASKVVEENGEQIEIFDVVHVDTQRAVTPDPDGNIVENSSKDPKFHATFVKGNANLISSDGKVTKFELASDDLTCEANGLAQTAAALFVPEYMWVNEKTGEAAEFKQEGGRIFQGPLENTDNFVLKRIVNIKLESVKSATPKKGWDLLVKILGEDDLYTPMHEILWSGYDSDSFNRSISIIAGQEEDDPRYGRKTGIQIDASKMKTAGLEGLINADALRNIYEKYDLDNTLENSSKFKSSISHLTMKNDNMGVGAEGFGSLSMIGSQGYDFVFAGEAVEDHKYKFKEGLAGEEVISPNYTHAVDFRGGGNGGVFLGTTGNAVLNQAGTVVHGRDDDNVYANMLRDKEGVYVQTMNDVGHVEIGNPADDPDFDDWGINNPPDDFYSIATADYAFSNWYEPEIEELRKASGVPNPPDGKGGADKVAEDAFSGVQTTSIDDIMSMVTSQISEHYKALKEMSQELLDDPRQDYSGAVIPGGYAAEMKDEMDTFFAGWNEVFGGSIGEFDIPAFDKTNEGNNFG